MNLRLVNRLLWRVSKRSGVPWLKVSPDASMQKLAARVLDKRQAAT